MSPENFRDVRETGPRIASAKKITIQTATKFASTENHGAVNNSAHLNSVTSIPEGVNVKRSDPRISHEMFTLKVNTSKPQQPGAFVIEHQKEKSAVLRKKVVIPFPSFSGLELVERKITLDTTEPPRMFYKRKNESRVNSEHFGQNTLKTSILQVPVCHQQPTKLERKFNCSNQTKVSPH